MLFSRTEKNLKRQKIFSIFPSSIHLEEKTYLFLIKKKYEHTETSGVHYHSSLLNGLLVCPSKVNSIKARKMFLEHRTVPLTLPCCWPLLPWLLWLLELNTMCSCSSHIPCFHLVPAIPSCFWLLYSCCSRACLQPHMQINPFFPSSLPASAEPGSQLELP